MYKCVTVAITTSKTLPFPKHRPFRNANKYLFNKIFSTASRLNEMYIIFALLPVTQTKSPYGCVRAAYSTICHLNVL